MKPRQFYPLVEIVWDDATSLEQGWVTGTFSPEPTLVTSVGFLVCESKRHLVIAQDIDPNGHHAGNGQIPKACIVKRTVLRKAAS